MKDMPARLRTILSSTLLSPSRRFRLTWGASMVCAIWTSVVWNGVGLSSAGEPRVWQGVEPSGRRRAVVLVCPPGGRPTLESRETEAPLVFESYERLEVPSTAWVYPPRRGDRWVHLLTGETCPVAVTRLTPNGLVGSLSGRSTVAIPWGALAAVAQPATETEQQLFTAEAEELTGPPPLLPQLGPAWSGEQSFVVPSGTDLPLLTIEEEITEGGISLSWLDFNPDDSPGANAEWSLELVFKSKDSSEILSFSMGGTDREIAARWEGERRCDVRAVSHRKGWRHLRVQWNAGEIVALIDNEILATGTRPDLPCAELRARRAATGGGENGQGINRPEVRLDDLRLFRSIPPLTFPPRHGERTGLWLASGDVLYQPDLVERFLNGDPPGGRLTQRDWRFVRGVIPQLDPEAPAAPPLEGWWVRLDWQPRYGERWEEPGSLRGVLEEVTDSSLVLRHPWLGTLNVPLEAVARLTPLWEGRRCELDPAVHHLGNNTRPGWSAPAPEGTVRKWTVNLTNEDLRRPFQGLALTVRDLEPTGGKWARQGIFREDLSKGGLLTEVWINNQQITDLNRWLDAPATADDPARLWIPIESGNLRAGMNTVELRQAPAVQKPMEFDDIELWDVAWEQPRTGSGGPLRGMGIFRSVR